MIIQSTTLDTEAKVKAIYGANTQWISHSGYVLRGATSGVVANSQTKTGGSDTHTITESELPSHTHSIPSLKSTSGKVILGSGTNFGYGFQAGGSSLGSNCYPYGDYLHTAASTTGAKGSGTAMSTLNNYKSVYIWERIA